jgi:integrase
MADADNCVPIQQAARIYRTSDGTLYQLINRRFYVATRRGHGEGSIYKRKVDGKVVGYIAMLDMGYVDGRRKRRAIYGKTRKDVSDRLDAEKARLKAGMVATGKSQTVEQYLTTWLNVWAKPKVRPATFTTYEMYVRRHLIPCLGRIQLDKLTADHVQDMLNRKGAELSPRSVSHLRAILRTALNRALKTGLVVRNVAALAEPPKVTHEEMHFLTAEQARHLIDLADEDHQALYRVALNMGLRRGELLGLRWSDVKFDRNELTVNYALLTIDGKPVLVEPKTTKSRRTLTMSPSVAEALRSHKARQNAERLRLGDKWIDMDLVFCGAHGLPLDGSALTKGFQRFLMASKLPKIRFHDLRHTCASLLLSRGTPIHDVAAQLGHSTPSLVLTTYGHAMPKAGSQVAATMESVLGG